MQTCAMTDEFDRYGFARVRTGMIDPLELELIFEEAEWLHDTDESVWLDEDEWDTVDEFMVEKEEECEF